jgi:hypothetical protein
VPLYAARIEDLGLGDFVKVDCTPSSHTALLALLLLPSDFHCEPSNASFAAVVEFCWTWIHPAPHSHQSPGT